MKNGDIFLSIVNEYQNLQYLRPYIVYHKGIVIRIELKNDFTFQQAYQTLLCYFKHDYILKVTKLPNKSNVRKKYKIFDKVYYIRNGCLYYGEIKVIVGDEYIMQTKQKVHKDIIIPSNWWILHERCVSAIHETSKCFLRLRIYKDLRVLIAKYIWESRNDEEWGYVFSGS